MSINSGPNQAIHVEDNGPLSFKQGEQFHSFKSFEERLQKHSLQSFVYFWRRDSKKICNSYWAATPSINEGLVYYFLKYSCIFGGVKYQRQGKSRKNVESKRDTNCQAFITLRLSKDQQTLEVVSTNNVHNHEISEAFSKSLSNGRKLTATEKMEVLEMLHLKIERRLIIEYVRMKMTKDLTMKDLFNLQASDKTDWAAVATRSKEVLETAVRNYIIGNDEEVVQLPTFKSLKSLKKRSKAYHQSTDGALVEVVLPDTASTLSSFSPKGGFSPMGPSASAVFLDNLTDTHSSEAFNYLTIGGDYPLRRLSPRKIADDPTFKIPKYQSSCDYVATEPFQPPACKEEIPMSTFSEDSEDSPEPLLQTSTQCLPDYIVQQCEESNESDNDQFLPAPDPPSSFNQVELEMKFNDHQFVEEPKPKPRRKGRKKPRFHACKFCPKVYERLWRMQIGVFKAQKQKLLEEIAVLRLKRRKLQTEVAEKWKI